MFFDDYFILRKFFNRRRAVNAGQYPNVACFAFDSITSEIILFGRFERVLLDLIFSRLLRFSSVFRNAAAVDIGANIGNHALYFAQHFGRVYAIEANPKTFALLTFNAKYSGYSNIVPIQTALGDSTGKLNFAEHQADLGRSGIVDPSSGMYDALRTQPGRIFEVNTESGDSVLSRQATGPIALLKIDVEGFESSVIKGLQSTIEEFHPLVLIEQLANEIRNGTTKTIELLRQFGYDEFYVPESTNKIRNRHLRILSKLLLGDTVDLVPTEYFSEKHYPMILCSSSKSPLSLGETAPAVEK